jgi:hypothetical protein
MGAAAAVAPGVAGAPGWSAASMSRLIIRPPGPDPRTESSATPFSSAMRRASGEALTRPPSPAGASIVSVATGCAEGIGASISVDASTAAASLWVAAAMPAATFSLPASNSEISSSSAATTPKIVPVGTVEFSATRITRSTPEPIDSTSMVALSVSTSTTTSPDSTGSPSLLTQLRTRPSSIVGDSFDMTIRVAIGYSR